LYQENQEEAYNGGIIYVPVPRKKKYIGDKEELSGGERTMAGIALLSAINIVRGVSFMVFDESDAFLDAGNSYRFLRFIKNLSVNNDIQAIVITHKHRIYRNAESLVGATFTP